MSAPTLSRRSVLGAGLAAASGLAPAQGQQTPIRIGGTLALTGPLAATAQIHRLVGEIYVEQARCLFFVYLDSGHVHNMGTR